MSIKENVEYIKEEISNEESFLESFFKIEKFVKKYKKLLITFASVVVVAFLGNSVYSYMQEQHKLEANRLLNKVLFNPNDTKSLEQLKAKDNTLYQLALYNKNNDAKIDIEFLKELASYNKAVKDKDDKAIATITTNPKFILKDFALFNQALLQAQKKDYVSAKETLKLIPVKSQVAQLVAVLNHFLLTKVQ